MGIIVNQGKDRNYASRVIPLPIPPPKKKKIGSTITDICGLI